MHKHLRKLPLRRGSIFRPNLTVLIFPLSSLDYIPGKILNPLALSLVFISSSLIISHKFSLMKGSSEFIFIFQIFSTFQYIYIRYVYIHVSKFQLVQDNDICNFKSTLSYTDAFLYLNITWHFWCKIYNSEDFLRQTPIFKGYFFHL